MSLLCVNIARSLYNKFKKRIRQKRCIVRPSTSIGWKWYCCIAQFVSIYVCDTYPNALCRKKSIAKRAFRDCEFPAYDVQAVGIRDLLGTLGRYSSEKCNYLILQTINVKIKTVKSSKFKLSEIIIMSNLKRSNNCHFYMFTWSMNFIFKLHQIVHAFVVIIPRLNLQPVLTKKKMKKKLDRYMLYNTRYMQCSSWRCKIAKDKRAFVPEVLKIFLMKLGRDVL